MEGEWQFGEMGRARAAFCAHLGTMPVQKACIPPLSYTAFAAEVNPLCFIGPLTPRSACITVLTWSKG